MRYQVIHEWRRDDGTNPIQLNVIYSKNIKKTLQFKPREHAVHIVLFE